MDYRAFQAAYHEIVRQGCPADAKLSDVAGKLAKLAEVAVKSRKALSSAN